MTAHIGLGTYVTVFAALLFLTAATVAAAYVHMGPLNDVVALSIAVTKALIVMLYFMHLRHSTRLTMLAVGAGFFWLGILVVLSLSDVLSRDWLEVPGR